MGALLYLIVNMDMGGGDRGGGGGGGGVNIFRAMADLFLFRGKRSVAKRQAGRVYRIQEGRMGDVSARGVS